MATRQTEGTAGATLREDRHERGIQELELGHEAVTAVPAPAASRTGPVRELAHPRTGNRASSTSGSVMRVLVMCVCTPDAP